MVMTSLEERVKFCDIEFFNIAVVLMSNDSASYTFLKDKELKQKADRMFAESSAKMILEWKENIV